MNQGKILSIEALRGAAALAVMLFHFTGTWLPPGVLKTIGSYGWLGVEAFFVISGFVIPHSMSIRCFDIRKDSRKFIWRRIVRLEPAYLVTVLLCFALQFASSMAHGFRGEPVTGRIVYDLLLHPLYLVPWFDGRWLTPVFWSLAIEFQYYFLALALSPLLLSKRPMRVRAALMLAAVGSLVCSDNRLVFFYLPIFAVGFLYFLTLTSRLPTLEAVGWGAAFLAVAAFKLSVLHAITALATVALFTVPVSRAMPLLWIGTISYSLYLVHVPIGGRVISLVTRFTDSPLLVIVPAVALSFAGALLLYRFVERPSIKAIGSQTLMPLVDEGKSPKMGGETNCRE